MKRIRSFILCMTAILIIVSPASALNILLTNDDGYPTPNILALYNAIKAKGHDVIISVPLENQSGNSSGMNWFENVSLSVDPENPDVHQVEGTPAMAVLYGIDILSQKRWGAYPDLVISGPNEGHNLGIITNHSGTVGAAVTALYRRIPAIAVSADEDTDTDGTEDKVARVTIRFIAALTRRKPILQPGTGINLNIPPLAEVENADEVKFVFSEIGTSSEYIPMFTMDLGRDEGFLTYNGIWPDNSPNTYEPFHDVPGITVGRVKDLKSLPERVLHPETKLLNSGKATISVINVTYAASVKQQRNVQSRLKSLVR